jgi:carbonic anhydrase
MKKIEQLLKGYAKFRAAYFENPHSELFEKLNREGQKPRTIVIGCSDSRVDPALLFDAAPGDLFMVRNVANLVPPCECDSTHHGTSAALEFAVCGLGVEHIIVMGHSQCGGITSLVTESPALTPHSFIGNWMELARPALEATKKLATSKMTIEETADLCAQQAIILSLENLKTFPWIQKRLESGQLEIHGWFFNIKEGALSHYRPDEGKFVVEAIA